MQGGADRGNADDDLVGSDPAVPDHGPARQYSDLPQPAQGRCAQASSLGVDPRVADCAWRAAGVPDRGHAYSQATAVAAGVDQYRRRYRVVPDRYSHGVSTG